MSSLYDRLSHQVSQEDGSNDAAEDKTSTTPKAEPQLFHVDTALLESSPAEKAVLNFQQLNETLDQGEEKKSGGLTPLDIVDLPDAEKKIMFALLRNRKAALEGVQKGVIQEALKSTDDISSLLQKLTVRGWLIPIGEPPQVRYKVNIRAKRGSTLWTALSSRLFDSLING